MAPLSPTRTGPVERVTTHHPVGVLRQAENRGRMWWMCRWPRLLADHLPFAQDDAGAVVRGSGLPTQAARSPAEFLALRGLAELRSLRARGHEGRGTRVVD